MKFLASSFVSLIREVFWMEMINIYVVWATILEQVTTQNIDWITAL